MASGARGAPPGGDSTAASTGRSRLRPSVGVVRLSLAARRVCDGRPDYESHEFAREVSRFLVALHAIDPADGPTAGPDTQFRGGPLTVWEPWTNETIEYLADKIDADSATLGVVLRIVRSFLHQEVVGVDRRIALEYVRRPARI